METTTNPPKDQSTHKDVYQIVTDRIIARLEEGTVPWLQPWGDAGIPRNLQTSRQYRGINLLLLSSLGYAHNLFLTYKQVNTMGGKVKKGEEGHIVVFWEVKDKEKTEADDTGNESKRSVILRYYTVFNIDQCENLSQDLLPVFTPFDPIASADEILTGMRTQPEIRSKENKAYYEPLRDFINMPKPEKFNSTEAYYATLFHEIVHWTGHHSRLSRPDLIQMSEFGSPSYSNEELVAEMGSSYLQAIAGITTEVDQSASYIQGWLKKLENDKRCLFTAASSAQKAVDYILNVPTEIEDGLVNE